MSTKFKPASEFEISKILFISPSKQSDSDPIPTCLLKQYAPVIVPTVTTIVNLSLSSGQFHHTLQISVISPLLKKSSLDKEGTNTSKSAFVERSGSHLG